MLTVEDIGLIPGLPIPELPVDPIKEIFGRRKRRRERRRRRREERRAAELAEIERRRAEVAAAKVAPPPVPAVLPAALGALGALLIGR